MWPWLPERVVVVHIPRVLTYLCSLEYTDNPRTTAVDRRSTPSARADRQAPLPMFRCPGHARTTTARPGLP